MAVCDKVCGYVLASAIGMALFHRERTGEGQEVHVPMLETMVAFNLVDHLWHGVLAEPEKGLGYPRMLTPHRRPFPTKDGHICILATTDAQSRHLFEALDCLELADDERFSTLDRRTDNIDELYAIIVDRMRRGGRLIYVGAGTSGRLGVLDASECPPTFGVSPRLVRAFIAGGKKALTNSVEGAEDSEQGARYDLAKIRISPNDALVGLAASGTTPYVLSAVVLAKKRGALTIGVTANPDSPLAKAVLIPITPGVGPEVLTGSTRLKAGTAQKMVLNMLSTATMVRLGHAYENLMIDLTRSNEKLRDRANRILVQASGKDLSAAEHALRQSEHNLRVALVMLKRKVSAVKARKLLKRSGGSLRRALGE